VGGVPDNELGVTVPLELELVRTDGVALAIASATVYSTGVMLMLLARQRKRSAPQGNRPPRFSFHDYRAEALRFDLRFADGTKATTTRSLRPGDAPVPPFLSLRRSGGVGHGTNAELWVWPLPPPGKLAFVVEWIEQGVSLTRREVDAQPILDEAAPAEQLWPDDRPVGPSTLAFG
jgi:hypothetical protein